MEAIINYSIGLIGILIGLATSYYFYKKSIRIKEPVYSIKSNNLISGSASTLLNLYIAYKGYQVENLTVSKILFYNRGAETIHRQDIETINPIRFSSEICKVLDASILQANNPSNNIRVHYDPSNKNVFLDFDYLDKNQGAVIQIIHTGLSSEYLELNGDIKGVSKITEISEYSNFRTQLEIILRNKFVIRLANMVFVLGMLAIVAVSLYAIAFPEQALSNPFVIPVPSQFLKPMYIITSVVMTLAIFMVVYTTRMVLRSNQIAPKGLEMFD